MNVRRHPQRLQRAGGGVRCRRLGLDLGIPRRAPRGLQAAADAPGGEAARRRDGHQRRVQRQPRQHGPRDRRVRRGARRRRKFFVFADMLELGPRSPDLHSELGSRPRGPVSISTGRWEPRARHALEAVEASGVPAGSECRHFDTVDDLGERAYEGALATATRRS